MALGAEGRSRHTWVRVVLSVLLLLIMVPAASIESREGVAADVGSCPARQYAAAQEGQFNQTIMPYTPDSLHRAVEIELTNPRASIDPTLVIAGAAHFDLLPHLQYDVLERDQGSAGNCWVWAGTGVMEVALDV